MSNLSSPTFQIFLYQYPHQFLLYINLNIKPSSQIPISTSYPISQHQVFLSINIFGRGWWAGFFLTPTSKLNFPHLPFGAVVGDWDGNTSRHYHF